MAKKIFGFQAYKQYVLDRVDAQAGGGRGEWGRIAKALRVHPSLISQIFRGNKDLTVEQAYDVADFFGLQELETAYLVKLVLLARAGTERARRALRAEAERLREEGMQVSSRLQAKSPLSESDRAVFYSTWLYSAVRISTSIPGIDSVDVIAKHLGVPKSAVAQIIAFLLEKGLCVEKQGRLAIGPQSTHLPASSPLISRHHQNWRLRALEKAERLNPSSELMFTAPVSLSHDDMIRVRSRLLEFIEETIGLIRNSPEERMACLNIDWVGVP